MEKYNLLTALSDAGKNKHGQPLKLFRCECGVEKVMVYGRVKYGYAKSCGCIKFSPEVTKRRVDSCRATLAAGPAKPRSKPENMEEINRKIAESMRKQWANGSRVKNSEATNKKVSDGLKRAYREGRKIATITSESAKFARAARSQEDIVEANRKNGIARIGTEAKGMFNSKDENNHNAKFWVLKSPEQQIISGMNLHKLVRDNAHLFLHQDLVWDGSNGCNATRCLRNLFKLKNGKHVLNSWKGWMIGDKMDREEAPQ